jgi:hypothetical protein
LKILTVLSNIQLDKFGIHNIFPDATGGTTLVQDDVGVNPIQDMARSVSRARKYGVKHFSSMLQNY